MVLQQSHNLMVIVLELDREDSTDADDFCDADDKDIWQAPPELIQPCRREAEKVGRND